jgi:Flp pilus assembly protein TadB
MIGGWMRLAQWAREIERKREERAEQRESHKKRRLRDVHAGGHELRHIELTAAEKERLRAKIAGRVQETTRGSKMKMVIYLYMAIMAFVVVGSALIVYMYENNEAVESIVSCLIVIALCVLWLKLSNIRKARSLAATIPGIILFVLGSAIAGFGVVPLHLKSVIVSRLLGIPELIASYFLCFSKGENTGN